MELPIIPPEGAWLSKNKLGMFHYYNEDTGNRSICGQVTLTDLPYAVSRRPKGDRLHVGCRACLKITMGYAHNAKNVYLS